MAPKVRLLLAIFTICSLLVIVVTHGFGSEGDHAHPEGHVNDFHSDSSHDAGKSHHHHHHHHHHHNHNHENTLAQILQSPLVSSIIKNCEKVPGFDYISESSAKLLHMFLQLDLLAKIMVSILIISVLPFCFLLIVPVPGGSCQPQSLLIKIMLGFASGCLLGDALLHLIPHAMESSKHSNQHQAHHEAGLYTLYGICSFFLVEMTVTVLRSISYTKPSSSKASKDGGCVLPKSFKVGNRIMSNEEQLKILRRYLMNTSYEDYKRLLGDDETSGSGHDENHHSAHHHHHGHRPISVSGFLNLLADVVHNFMDGVAVGCAYMIGDKSGVLTTIGVFFHEVPHEFSDFAFLIKSGFSRTSALLVQLVTASGAVIGGLSVYYIQGARDFKYSSMISSFTAGGFIYISCASIVPDMLSKKPSSHWMHGIYETLGMMAGIAIFQTLLMYE